MAERRSRSHKRREGDLSQEVAKALMALTSGQLAALDLDDDLKEEAAAAAKVPTGVARRREERRLGGVLRRYDLEEVQAVVHALGDAARADAARFRRAEHWRAQLLTSDQSIDLFLQESTAGNEAALRTAVANGRHEIETGAPKGAQKKLFRLVRDWLQEPSALAPPEATAPKEE